MKEPYRFLMMVFLAIAAGAVFVAGHEKVYHSDPQEAAAETAPIEKALELLAEPGESFVEGGR